MRVKNDIHKIIKQLKAGLPSIKVGVLGDKTARTDNGKSKEKPNNATIGLFHEFGTKNKNGSERMPQRSWLREPLMDHMQKAINKLSKMKKLDINLLSQKIGGAAVSIIQEGFTNGGFGKWRPTKSGKDNKKAGSGNILVDTQQLRDSVTFRVD